MSAKPRRLQPGDRYTIPGCGPAIYRVLRVTEDSALVRQENRERKTVTITDPKTGEVRTFTPEVGSAAFTVSPYSAVRVIEEGVGAEVEPDPEPEPPLGPSLGPSLTIVLL